MAGLTNCIYTTQGELVCLPNKKTEQESYEGNLIETFRAQQRAKKKAPEPIKSTSRKCKKSTDCPTGEGCSKFGYCRKDVKR